MRLLDLFVFKYNRTDFHELNLDWIISDMRTLAETLQNFISLNTIKYADPIQWNISTQYESNTVVVNPATGTAYLSTQPVPSGVALTNTDYWTVIFDLDIAQANNNITLRDDGNNVLSTFTSVIGDWLLWNGTLYKVIADIGLSQAYVAGYNIERYTVEEFINDYVTQLSNDINNVINSIGDLDNLTTTDKSNVVAAINEVVDAVNNIIVDISARITYNSAADFNLDNTGATDCSAALAAITNNIALKAGTYKISADCVVNAQVVMCGGAVFDVDSGVTLTFNKQIEANPNVQIFTGSGNVVINGFAYPEWFGAVVNDNTADCSGAINKAYTAANELRLNGGYYYVTNTVYFNKSGVKVSGIGNGRSFDNPKSQSVICCTSTSLTILSIGNSTGLWNGLFENFGVYRTNDGADGAIGIHIYNTLLSHFNRLFSRSTISFHCTANVTPMFNECSAFPRAQDISGVNIYGFYFKNDEVNPANNLTGNPSTYITKCNIEGSAPTNAYELGLAWTNGLSDLFIDGLECAFCNRGIQIDGANASTMHDISIKKVVIDNYGNFAIRIVNCSDAEVVIDGGYVYGAQVPFLLSNLKGGIVITHINAFLATTNTSAIFRLEGCYGITMRDNICRCLALLNIASTSTKIISDDIVVNNVVSSNPVIYVADGSHMKLNINVQGSGTFTRAIYAGALYQSEINVTGINSSQVSAYLATIAGTNYSAVGAAGTNLIEGIYA